MGIIKGCMACLAECLDEDDPEYQHRQQWMLEKERLKKVKQEQERQERARQERELLERAQQEQVRQEQERQEQLRQQEQRRLEQQRQRQLEAERLEEEQKRQRQLEAQRRQEQERQERARQEWERLERAQQEEVRREQEQWRLRGEPLPQRSPFADQLAPGGASSLISKFSLGSEPSDDEPHKPTPSELDPVDSGFSDEDPLLSKIKVRLAATPVFAPPPWRAPAQPLSPPAAQAPRGSGAAGQVDRAVEVDYRHLQMQKLLGEGSYGRVYAAKYRVGRLAVKVLVKIEDIDFLLDPHCPLLARLRQEAEKMAALRHDNVVRLKAICVRPPCLLTEYAPNRSVADLLTAAAAKQADKVAVLTWEKRVGMALDAARGMAYLHGLNPPMVHANLKTSNLLINREGRVKVADTNVQQLVDVDGSASSTMAAMNPQYMAPEQLEGRPTVPASDVFAFGVILWELLTWQKPWAKENVWSIVQNVTGGGSLPIPADHELPGSDKAPRVELEAYKRLMVHCWDKSELDRPTFVQVIGELECVGGHPCRLLRSTTRVPLPEKQQASLKDAVLRKPCRTLARA